MLTGKQFLTAAKAADGSVALTRGTIGDQIAHDRWLTTVTMQTPPAAPFTYHRVVGIDMIGSFWLFDTAADLDGFVAAHFKQPKPVEPGAEPAAA